MPTKISILHFVVIGCLAFVPVLHRLAELQHADIDDPCITYVPELRQYAIVYAPYPSGGPGVALALTKDFHSFERLGVIMQPKDKDAALSMQGRRDVDDFVAAFTGSHRFVLDYLVEEVLSLQSEKTRDFLLRTSILERMNASLCDAVIGESDGQAMLEELERSNLFGVGLDSERQWYRYHHLFTDVLRQNSNQFYPAEINELHCHASAWLEENGFLDEAVCHALAGRDMERAGRITERIDSQLLLRGELVAILGWLESVKELLPDRPRLCIDKAWALILTGQLDEVESLLQRAEHLLASNPAVENAQ